MTHSMLTWCHPRPPLILPFSISPPRFHSLQRLILYVDGLIVAAKVSSLEPNSNMSLSHVWDINHRNWRFNIWLKKSQLWHKEVRRKTFLNTMTDDIIIFMFTLILHQIYWSCFRREKSIADAVKIVNNFSGFLWVTCLKSCNLRGGNKYLYSSAQPMFFFNVLSSFNICSGSPFDPSQVTISTATRSATSNFQSNGFGR